MQECQSRLKHAPEDFASLLRQLPWQTPSHVVGLQGPASRARLLQSARFEKSYKGKAADLMQLLPMIACLVELVDVDDRMAGPLASYAALLEIHRELSRLKRLGQISDTSRLQRLQREHHDLCLAAYGQGILKPKHHWRHHAAKQIQDWGAYMDTSAFEAKHQMYKGVANKNFDVLVSSPAWSKAILDRMLCSCINQMKVHFERRALLGRGKETTILWGQQKLRAFKQVQWEGFTWKPGDFQLEPFPGKVLHCCLSSTERPFLLLQEYTIASKSRFSMVFRAAQRVRNLQDVLRSKLASWWLLEETGLVRALP